LDFNFKIIIEDCEVGDHYNNETKTYTIIIFLLSEKLMNFRCETCPVNFYSLDDPKQFKSCSFCPDKAYCPGGSKIAPLPGYWRYDLNTTKILQCPVKSACLLHKFSFINV